ncbi:hypothetical protein AB0A05_26830 [Streptomyces sp. NPDC046374]|uniref:hypothetical protein n=1 Tax=Streptomyces sp. NPDC046374 TaxID=3154917 RepID=UPI0033D0A830
MQVVGEIPIDWEGPAWALAEDAEPMAIVLSEHGDIRIDWIDGEEPAPVVESEEAKERAWREEPVYCYLASQRGGPRWKRVLWKVTRAEAMRLCSDDRTKGPGWMVVWTANPGSQKDDDWRWFRDNGSMDHVLREFGIKPITGKEGKRAAA